MNSSVMMDDNNPTQVSERSGRAQRAVWVESNGWGLLSRRRVQSRGSCALLRVRTL